jgi:hypothetical protein
MQAEEDVGKPGSPPLYPYVSLFSRFCSPPLCLLSF